jgi:hypothetical protein
MSNHALPLNVFAMSDSEYSAPGVKAILRSMRPQRISDLSLASSDPKWPPRRPNVNPVNRQLCDLLSDPKWLDCDWNANAWATAPGT